MATIIGSTTRRRRKRLQGNPGIQAPQTISSDPAHIHQNTTSVVGKELCRRMVHYPRDTSADPDTSRRKVPTWVRKEDNELFHAFCVAHDILGTSYRPTECLYWDESN
jgi:hypothetical protein